MDVKTQDLEKLRRTIGGWLNRHEHEVSSIIEDGHAFAATGEKIFVLMVTIEDAPWVIDPIKKTSGVFEEVLSGPLHEEEGAR